MRYLNALFLFLVIVGGSTGCSSAWRRSISSPPSPVPRSARPTRSRARSTCSSASRRSPLSRPSSAGSPAPTSGSRRSPMRRIAILLAAAAVSLAIAAPVAARQPGPTIVETAIAVNQATGEFDELIAAVSRAGLVSTLNGNRQFTVFAPTDAASRSSTRRSASMASTTSRSPRCGRSCFTTSRRASASAATSSMRRGSGRSTGTSSGRRSTAGRCSSMTPRSSWPMSTPRTA